jgi:Mn-containing catalase
MHLKPMKKKMDAAAEDPLIAIAGGGGVGLVNSMGDAGPGLFKDYRRAGCRLAQQYRSEARARSLYERLIDFCDDPGSKDALQFLMTREITI